MREFMDWPGGDTPQRELMHLLLEQESAEAPLRQLFVDEQVHANEIFVDVGIMHTAVDKDKAAVVAESILTLLQQFPRLDPKQLPAFGQGPSYIEAGGLLNSQQTAIALFAIGEALGWWQVVTPKKMFGENLPDDLSREMMGMGYVTIERLT